MTVATGLLVSAVLIGVCGPVYLRRTISPQVRPNQAMLGWVLSLMAVPAAALGGAVLLSVPDSAGVDGLIGMAQACINSGAHLWETIFRLSGACAVLAAGGRVLFVASTRLRRDRAHRTRHLAMLRYVCRAEPRNPRLLWLADSLPVAYSIGGRDGAVVATTGVSQLQPRQRAAILAHERAHLRGWHHRIVLVTEILSTALPFVPLFRAAPPAVRVLVELAADASAARSCGPQAVRDGLRTVSAATAPGSALAMSRESVELRLRWLPADDSAPVSATSLRGRVTATVATTLSPFVLGIGSSAGLVVILCLATGTTPF